MKKYYLVTGSAGFIGFSLALKLLKNNKTVYGIDNLNRYYDVNLKLSRLKILRKYKNFKFKKINICNSKVLEKIFKLQKFNYVFHLAAQAGVRYSLKKPDEYIKSNISGFFNILECCRKYKVKHLVYASSSSVYGANKNYPFSEKDNCSHPIQLYAATKLSNELMAHAYSSIYSLPTTGVRFFTVYGPWGRPDQALFIFTKKIIKNQVIKLFNFGDHSRDFTYIDDIVNGLVKIGKSIPRKNKNWNPKKPDPSFSHAPYQIFNIASNKRIKLTNYVKLIEKFLNKKAKINLLPLQTGDVVDVYSNISKIKKQLNYRPRTDVKKGVKNFIIWFKKYYNFL